MKRCSAPKKISFRASIGSLHSPQRGWEMINCRKQLRRIGTGFLLLLTVPTPTVAQSAASNAQAKEDFKLAEFEPYYGRYKVLASCLRSALGMSGGSPTDRAKIAFGLCQKKSDDFRAILGSKIGPARATKAIEVYRSVVIQSLQKQEEAASQKNPSPDERIARKSDWSSGAWHVLKISGQCAAIHRFQGQSTFGGLSFAGATAQDIMIINAGQGPRVWLFTPSAGHAQDLAFYKDKKVKVAFAAYPVDSGKTQILESDSEVKKSGEYYFIDLDALSEVNVLFRFIKLEVLAVNGDQSTPLRGYKFDISGIEDAISAYKRCVG